MRLWLHLLTSCQPIAPHKCQPQQTQSVQVRLAQPQAAPNSWARWQPDGVRARAQALEQLRASHLSRARPPSSAQPAYWWWRPPELPYHSACPAQPELQQAWPALVPQQREPQAQPAH